jgi:hypothetical protein
LPAKSVLYAGTVCKAWRRITINTSFLAEHARLQPADVVLYTYKFSPRCKDLHYPDTYLKWSIGIAIRIGYGDTPIRRRYGISEVSGK